MSPADGTKGAIPEPTLRKLWLASEPVSREISQRACAAVKVEKPDDATDEELTQAVMGEGAR